MERAPLESEFIATARRGQAHHFEVRCVACQSHKVRLHHVDTELEFHYPGIGLGGHAGDGVVWPTSMR